MAADCSTLTVSGDMRWTDYDGDIPYGDFDITPNSFARTEVTRYLDLSGQQAVGDGAETYYHGDQIGSTMATSDAAGVITGRSGSGSGGSSGGGFAPVVYTAFGEFLTASGVAGGDPPAGHPRYAYAGAFGYETGGFGGDDRLLWRDGVNPNLPPITLQHVGWRWYQPEIGRFVQGDRIGVWGGINLYAYASADPATGVDPDGLFQINPNAIDNFIDGVINGYPVGALGSGIGAGQAANFKWRLGIGRILNRSSVVTAGAWIGWNAGKLLVNYTPITDWLGLFFQPCFAPPLPNKNTSVPPTPEQMQEIRRDLDRRLRKAWENPRVACFVAGTPVHTEFGTRGIETIRPGDEVIARDSLCHDSNTAATIGHLTGGITNELVVIYVAGEEICCSPMHRFWVETRGWTRAKELEIGMGLLTIDGHVVSIEGLSGERCSPPRRVFNFEVLVHKTYYVGHIGLLVHNPK